MDVENQVRKFFPTEAEERGTMEGAAMWSGKISSRRAFFMLSKFMLPLIATEVVPFIADQVSIS